MASAGLQNNNVFLIPGYPNWIQYSRCGLVHIKQGEWPFASAHWLKGNPSVWIWGFEHECAFVTPKMPEVFTKKTQKTQNKETKPWLVW